MQVRLQNEGCACILLFHTEIPCFLKGAFAMKTRLLKDLRVSEIGMGCMGMSHAAGAPMELDAAARVIREAVDAGYTFFDTAKNYGFKADPHHNEKILGRALAGIRQQVVIATKCGVEFDYAVDPDVPPLLLDSSRESIIRSVDGSLKRLGTDYIDLYFQARVDPNVEPEAVAETMAALIKAGKILHWGLSEADEEYMRRANAVCPLTAVENSYSMVNRRHEREIAFLEENGIGWVAHGPMFKGLLSGGYQMGAQFARDDWRGRAITDENLRRAEPLLDYLRALGQQKQATPGQLALAWLLHRKPYIVPIPGMRSRARLLENAGAAEIALTADELARIDALSAQDGKN